MAIVTRSGLGRALTWAEEDNNFSELNTRTITGWQNLNGDIRVGTTTPPTYVDYKGIQLLSFDSSTNQEVSVQFHLPHDFVSGSDIYLHSHVVSPTASVGTVRWGFSMMHAGEWATGDPTPTADQYFSTPTTLYGENYKTALDQDLHRLVMTNPLNIPALLPDNIILCRYWRDAIHANDTYPDPVFLLYVDLYYQSQKFGTVNR